ncbi:MAG: hypothetical protein H7Y04_11760 [Verrucomicrobia bacterium]|nr:hypothetical protein [Cytophagales bacterium]
MKKNTAKFAILLFSISILYFSSCKSKEDDKAALKPSFENTAWVGNADKGDGTPPSAYKFLLKSGGSIQVDLTTNTTKPIIGTGDYVVADNKIEATYIIEGVTYLLAGDVKGNAIQGSLNLRSNSSGKGTFSVSKQ